jgi:hypothetical protein
MFSIDFDGNACAATAGLMEHNYREDFVPLRSKNQRTATVDWLDGPEVWSARLKAANGS